MEEKFKLITSKKIKVGECPENLIDLYVESVRARIGEAAKVRKDFTDKTFLKTAAVPSGQLEVRAYEIAEDVTMEECEKFLRDCQSLFLGAQGLVIARNNSVVAVPYSKRVDEDGGVLKLFALGHPEEPIPCLGQKWFGFELIGHLTQNEVREEGSLGHKGDIILAFNQVATKQSRVNHK